MLKYKVLVINGSKQQKTAFFCGSFVIDDGIKKVKVEIRNGVYRYFDYTSISESDKFDLVIYSETEFTL